MPKDVGEKFKAFAAKHNFVRRIDGAETHWYFIEGAHAFEEKLYLAASLSFLNGIESSIRTLLMYLDTGFDSNDLTGKVLSNGLLVDASNAGMDVRLLAFPDEENFVEKLKSKKTPVEIVRNRNNLCHGNIFEYIQEVPETGDRIFTPECLLPVASRIKKISEEWSLEVARFKEQWPND